MLYAYAIVEAGPDAAPECVPTRMGILPDRPVRLVEHEGLAAVVSDVPVEVFGGEALRRLLEEDAAWTRERILAHQQVVDALLPWPSVLPLKFCTVFAGADDLTAALHRDRDTLRETLDRLRGAREWGVKMFCDADVLAGAPFPPSADTDASPGAAFFQRKRREKQRQEEEAAVVARCVEDSHRRLAACARTAVSNPPQPAPRGQRTTMVLNGAYLVAAEAEPAMRACLHELARTYRPQGFDYTLTGPWAPYNFTRPDHGQREFASFSAPERPDCPGGPSGPGSPQGRGAVG